MRPKDSLFTLLFLLLSFAFVFLAGEVTACLMDLKPRRVSPPRYLAWNGEGWTEKGTWGDGHIKRPSPLPRIEMGEYVPGARFRIVYSSNPRGYFDADGGVPASINSMGLRGPEVSAGGEPGTFRILGMGDSFAFGLGVRDGDTYLAQLEKLLNEGPEGPGFEVLNAGVAGYNTRDEVDYLRHRGPGMNPDLVLIGFYLNDAYSERTFYSRGEGGLQPLLREPRGLAKVSHLWDFLQYRFRSRRLRKSVEDFYRSSYFGEAETFLEDPGDKKVDWTTAKRSLGEAVALAEAGGFRLALVIFPHLYGLDGDYPFEGIHRLVLEECRSLGIPALDLLDTFRGQKDEELWVHITDHHPNETAHRMAAVALARYLTGPGRDLLEGGGRKSPAVTAPP